MVEFAEPGGGFHTLSVYIDHNLGGLVKDVLLAERLAELRETMAGAPDADRRRRSASSASARHAPASRPRSYMLDHTLDPPVDEDVHSLRALIDARLRLFPAGFELPDTYVEMPQEERDALLDDFLASPEGGAGAATRTPSSPPSWRSTSAPTTTTAGRCAGVPWSSRSSCSTGGAQDHRGARVL